MNQAATCPSRQDLERLVQGEMPFEQVEKLAQHVEKCESCVKMVQTLHGEDTLVEVIRKQAKAQGRPPDAILKNLLEKVRGLRIPSAGATAAMSKGGLPAEVEKELYDFLAPAQTPGELGRLGSYRVLKLLGAGGMGVVFQAEDVGLKRTVAIKAMKPALATSGTAKQRFLREAQTTASIKHDHIVTIYQVGEDRSVPFLAMEFLEGMSLDDYLKNSKPPVEQILRIGREAAEGLAAAHERGLIHRDIKPGNIWVEAPKGRVKILDFGLARATDDNTQLTQSGAIVGTPAYMAPEQANSQKVDHRTDLFSLGCVLYRMCTGQMPFKGESTMGVLMAVMVDVPKPVRELNPSIPQPLADLVMKLLEKKPDDRPQSAKAVEAMLKAIERTVSNGGHAPADTVVATSTKPQKSKGRRLVAIAAALCLLIGGGWMAGQIIIRVKNKDGSETEIKVPAGATVEIEKDGKPLVLLKPAHTAKGTQVETNPVPVVPVVSVARGQSISPMALVREPAQLKGAIAWTIETTLPRGTGGDGGSTVRSIALSDDGSRLAASGTDGIIRVWETSTGKIRHALLGHRSRVTVLEWSPNSKYLASGGNDTAVRVWEVDTGVCRVAKQHAGPVRALAWSPTSDIVASGADDANDSSIRLSDIRTGTMTTIIKANAGGTRSLAWSPDGKILASGSGTQIIQFWGVDGKPITSLEAHKGAVYSLCFSPDSKTLVSLGQDNTCKLWDVPTGKVIHVRDVVTSDRKGLAWSPDGKSVLFRDGKEGVFGIWERDTWKPVVVLSQKGSAAAWSGNGKIIATTDELQQTIQTYDAETGIMLRRLAVHRVSLQGASWSADGRFIAYSSTDETMRVLDPSSCTSLRTYRDLARKYSRVAYSPDSTTLACLGKRLVLYNAQSGKSLGTIGEEGSSTIAWSPDNKTLAVAGPANRVDSWNIETGLKLKSVDHPEQVRSLAWSPDGKLLAACRAKSIAVSNAQTGQSIVDPIPCNDGMCVAFSPDGKMLAAAAHGGPVEVLDTGSWKSKASVNAGGGHATLAWSPDGKALAIGVHGNYGHAVHLWDVSTGKLGQRLSRHAGTTNAIMWSADGVGLAAGDTEGIIWFWNTSTGKPRGLIQSLRDGQYLAVSPDGHYSGSPGIENEIVYVVQTEKGQETLTPNEFAKKYGWKNDPDKVRLTTDSQPATPAKGVDEAWIKMVQGMQADEQVKAVEAKLKELNPTTSSKPTSTIKYGKVVRFTVNTVNIKNISPLRVFTHLESLDIGTSTRSELEDLTPLQRMKLQSLRCVRTLVSDLTPLKGMPLKSLDLPDTPVSDLSPLKGMPLEWLKCSGTRVSNLSPLEGMPLKELYLGAAPVSDLTPLRGMQTLELLHVDHTAVSELTPLKGISLRSLWVTGKVSDISPIASPELEELIALGAPITDLSSLKSCPRLKRVHFGGCPVKDITFLRQMKSVEWINDKPAAEFWKEVDAKQPPKKP